MRSDVTFTSSGFRIAGHLHTPDDLGPGTHPAIVVGHPASGVKEQSAGIYAQRLAEQGFIALAFDTATQGESGGEPRNVEDPARRVGEIKDAVSFLSVRSEVDPDRIGAVGICASGGYVVPAAATDHRIKAVATVSGVDLGRIYREGADGTQDPAVLQTMLDAAAAARTAEARGEGVVYVPIFPESAEAARAAGTFMEEGYDYYCTPRAFHPRSMKESTMTSFDLTATFDAFEFANLIAPRPLLAIIGRNAVTKDNSMRAVTNANEPKQFFWIDGASHQDLYDKPEYVTPAVAKLTDFFKANLGAA